MSCDSLSIVSKLINVKRKLLVIGTSLLTALLLMFKCPAMVHVPAYIVVYITKNVCHVQLW